MNLGSIESLAYLYPEGILVLSILAIFLVDLCVEDKERLGNIALVGAALALVFTSGLSFFGVRFIEGLQGAGEGWLFHRMIALDSFAIFFKVILSLSVVGTVWMSLGSREINGPNQGEYYGILLASGLGMFFMASATNLLLAYLSLEFVSLTSYVLTGYLTRNRRSGEAALKYLIYGGVASGTMIYGMSWIFGLTGSLDYAEINAALLQNAPDQLTLFIALVLMLAGFGYKIAAVPFHMWAPDVYHGAPIPVTAFLSVGSKAAGFALLMRFFYPALSQSGERRHVAIRPRRRVATAHADCGDGDHDAWEPRRPQPAECEAALSLFQYCSRWLHPHGVCCAQRRRAAGDAVLHRRLLFDEPWGVYRPSWLWRIILVAKT